MNSAITTYHESPGQSFLAGESTVVSAGTPPSQAERTLLARPRAGDEDAFSSEKAHRRIP